MLGSTAVSTYRMTLYNFHSNLWSWTPHYRRDNRSSSSLQRSWVNGPRSHSHDEARPGFETRKPSSRAHVLMHTPTLQELSPMDTWEADEVRETEKVHASQKKRNWIPRTFTPTWSETTSSKKATSLLPESRLCFRSWQVHPKSSSSLCPWIAAFPHPDLPEVLLPPCGSGSGKKRVGSVSHQDQSPSWCLEVTCWGRDPWLGYQNMTGWRPLLALEKQPPH